MLLPLRPALPQLLYLLQTGNINTYFANLLSVNTECVISNLSVAYPVQCGLAKAAMGRGWTSQSAAGLLTTVDEC
jgi:hypothetical protein